MPCLKKVIMQPFEEESKKAAAQCTQRIVACLDSLRDLRHITSLIVRPLNRLNDAASYNNKSRL